MAVQAADDCVYLERAGGVPGDLCGDARSGVTSRGNGKTETLMLQQLHSS